MSKDIKHHIVIYRNVFIALLVLTVITVGASYIHFSAVWLGLFVGLLIASIKGFLVASQFMHLNDEKNWIYVVLILTTIFCFALLFVPAKWDTSSVGYGNGAYEHLPEVSSEHHDDHDHHGGD